MNLRAMSFLPIYSLWARELVLFLRAPSRVAGTIGLPLLFWLIAGFKATHADASVTLAASSIFVVVFASIGAAYSVIEDHNKGFLKSVLVSPVSDLELVLGKVLGCATVGVLQSLVFLVFVSQLNVGKIFGSCAMLVLVAVALSALGFLLAWPMESGQGFHVVVNLALIPLWFLTGVLYDASQSPIWLRYLTGINPLTHAIRGLAAIFEGRVFWPGFAVVSAFGAVLFFSCFMMVKLRTKAHLE